MDQDTLDQKMGQIWARCWTDASFKARLLADPLEVLRSEGLVVPAGLQVRVLEDSPEQVHWVIPARPSEVSDDELESVVAGSSGFLNFLKSGLPISWSIARTPVPVLFGKL